MCQSKTAGGKRCEKRHNYEALDLVGEKVAGLPKHEFAKTLAGIRHRENELHRIMTDTSSDTETLAAATEEWNVLTDGMEPKDYKFSEVADEATKKAFWKRFYADWKNGLSPKNLRTLMRRITRALAHKLPTGLIRSYENMKNLIKNNQKGRKFALTSVGIAAALALSACNGGNTDNNDNPAPSPTTSQSQSASPEPSTPTTSTPTVSVNPVDPTQIDKAALNAAFGEAAVANLEKDAATVMRKADGFMDWQRRDQSGLDKNFQIQELRPYMDEAAFKILQEQVNSPVGTTLIPSIVPDDKGEMTIEVAGQKYIVKDTKAPGESDKIISGGFDYDYGQMVLRLDTNTSPDTAQLSQNVNVKIYVEGSDVPVIINQDRTLNLIPTPDGQWKIYGWHYANKMPEFYVPVVPTETGK